MHQSSGKCQPSWCICLNRIWFRRRLASLQGWRLLWVMSPAGWQWGDNINQLLSSKDKHRPRTNHRAGRESYHLGGRVEGAAESWKQMVDRACGHREISTQRYGDTVQFSGLLSAEKKSGGTGPLPHRLSCSWDVFVWRQNLGLSPKVLEDNFGLITFKFILCIFQVIKCHFPACDT